MANPERINIKDLTLEEPEKKKSELPFDPERDITEEDWKRVRESLLSIRQEEHPEFTYPELVKSVKILFPERVSEFNFDDDFLWRRTKLWSQRHGLPSLLDYVFEIKLAFPERISELNLDKLQEINKHIEVYRQRNDWAMFASAAMKMKILFPERIAELHLDETAWVGMKEELEQLRTPDLWGYFAKRAMAMKILYPEKSSELNLDSHAWEGMKQDLEKCRAQEHKTWWHISEQAIAMKILVAEEIKITDKGLEIIMPKEKPVFKEEVPSMPQRRKF